MNNTFSNRYTLKTKNISDGFKILRNGHPEKPLFCLPSTTSKIGAGGVHLTRTVRMSIIVFASSLLIAPIWNRNRIAGRFVEMRLRITSNRTSLESPLSTAECQKVLQTPF